MKRIAFLKNLLGASLLPTAALATEPTNVVAEARRLRRELTDAWAQSERMTLLTAGQMPADGYDFRYTPEAMTFAEQWRHCCTFTTAQLAARLDVADLYATRPVPTQLTKPQVLTELKAMYAYVRTLINTVPDERLLILDDYMGDKMPNWRLFYALENHIIHHRGQCMVYLRLKGIAPEGYLGW